MSSALARKGVSVFITNWLLVPLQIVVSVLVVRAVGAEGKGVLTLLTMTVTLISTAGQFSLPIAAVYFSRRKIYTERTLLANYAVVALVVTLVVFALVILIQDLFIATFLAGSQVTSDEIYLAVASLPSLLIIVFVSNLHLANGRTFQYAQIQIVLTALNVVLIFVFVVLLGFGVPGVLSAQLISALLAAGVAIVGVLFGTRGEKTVLSWRILKKMVRFSAPQYAASLASQMFKRMDTFLLAFFLDVSAVGYYSVAMLGYELCLSVPRALNSLLMGEASGRDERKAAAFVAQTTRIVSWLMTGVVTVVACASPWLIPLVYGSDFVQSVAPMIILLLASVLVGLSGLLQAYFVGVARPGINGTLTMIAGLVNLGFSLWLIPLAGIVGNAAATLIGAIVSAGLFLTWFHRLSGLPVATAIILTRDDMVRLQKQLYIVLQRISVKRLFYR